MTLIQKTNDGELYYYDIRRLTKLHIPTIWVYKNNKFIVVADVGCGEPRSGVVSADESLDQMIDKIKQWHKVLEGKLSIDDLDYVTHQIYYMAKLDDNNELIIFEAIGGDWFGITNENDRLCDNLQLPFGWDPQYMTIIKRLRDQREDL
jgi:hypothetical protein